MQLLECRPIIGNPVYIQEWEISKIWVLFGSSRSGYTYDIPYPPRKDLNWKIINEFLATKQIGKERVVYPGKGIDDSPSSGESDDGHMILSRDERLVKEESRESETECDRICKYICVLIRFPIGGGDIDAKTDRANQ
ncbi:down syndrome cell adhesion molecule [Caerostris extrusa]|uniref:Down syndrome cell adhesion molecule n=1 Tax=Caerostris extrusa TaxID=172846 RepID=A0AAV4WTP9_CAEEX|nr:down syndrome cell adhesion molecule [Caerostris extrusa]